MVIILNIITTIGVIFTVIGTIVAILAYKNSPKNKNGKRNKHKTKTKKTKVKFLGIFDYTSEKTTEVDTNHTGDDNMYNLNFDKNKEQLKKNLDENKEPKYNNMDFASDEFYIDFLKTVEEKKHGQDTIIYK